MYPRPEHYVPPSRYSAYTPRLKAIELPCPAAVQPRTASICAAGAGVIIYMCWALMLWKGHASE